MCIRSGYVHVCACIMHACMNGTTSWMNDESIYRRGEAAVLLRYCSVTGRLLLQVSRPYSSFTFKGQTSNKNIIPPVFFTALILAAEVYTSDSFFGSNFTWTDEKSPFVLKSNIYYLVHTSISQPPRHTTTISPLSSSKLRRWWTLSICQCISRLQTPPICRTFGGRKGCRCRRRHKSSARIGTPSLTRSISTTQTLHGHCRNDRQQSAKYYKLRRYFTTRSDCFRQWHS